MGIKYSFADNMLYGSEDVNEIAQCLTGSGVMPFESKESYSTADLNSVTEALATSGTSLGGCKCRVENSGTADMCIKIAQGIIFFESGVRLVVDSDEYSVPVLPNTEGYVFAHYSPSLQIADIVFAAELPNDGEYVELAEIKANGELRDLRKFAKSKIASMGRTTPYAIEEDRIVTYNTHSSAPDYNGGRVFGKINLSGIDISRYRYLLYKYYGSCEHLRQAEPIDKYVDLDALPANFTIQNTAAYVDPTLAKVTLEGNMMIFYISDTYPNDSNLFKNRLDIFNRAKQYFVLV